MKRFFRAVGASGLMTAVMLAALLSAGVPAPAHAAPEESAGKTAPPRSASEAPGGAGAGAATGEAGTPSDQALPPEKPVEVAEVWTGSLYTSTFRVGVCFSAQGKVRGVVQLRLANGDVDVYHIWGSVKDNEVEAAHSSGHSFKGQLVSPDKVEGVISLKNGMKIKLEGKRLRDAPVTEDCAPLP